MSKGPIHAPPGGPSRPAARAAGGAVLLLVACMTGPGRAWADPESGTTATMDQPSGPWLSFGLLGGITQLSRGLADYQWNTSARPSFGLQALVGADRLAGGLRLWSTHTTQGMGDVASASKVRATSLELVGEYRLAETWGIGVLASAGAGWLRVGYHPDRIAFQPSGSGAPIVVDLAPIDAWVGIGGLGLAHALGPAWTVGLAVEARRFGLDTARRVGQTVVEGRETFCDWSARIELARRYGRG